MEHLSEAEERGRQAALDGMPPMPEPFIGDYTDPATRYRYAAANRYHGHWMTGYESVKENQDGYEEATN